MKKKAITLKSQKEIKKLFKKGIRVTKYPLTFIYQSNDLDFNRYLFCANRSIGKAVKRNRVKRVLRAIIYNLNESTKQGFDIALVANFNFILMDYREREALCLSLLKKIKYE
ncbi:MAG: ribonuclease P protein component [Leptospiraceae bacterium]|nr:ribonuclease P protein component [Leptospiraceae bacterium]MCP5497697.1 ribonuclease P protein component [Leptospiraceae bacterium]